MHLIQNPPDAASLMMSARSFGNYDLAGALADLIDNSIKAKARKIWIRCDFNEGDPTVSIVDDGEGMSGDDLIVAMRPASTNPTAERSPDDLGRFGWGMKSASFSQCRRLTVISRQKKHAHGAEWDLDSIDGWAMGLLSPEEIDDVASSQLPAKSGTEVIWNKCDRLSESGSLTTIAFNDQIAHAAERLSLIFHRFLEGRSGKAKLQISVNGRLLEPFDPFHTSHNATIPREVETLHIGHHQVHIRPYILPHFSKLGDFEHERLGGEDGFLRNQGFYVYRNDRLIIHGTWFRLAKFGELSQLVRIAVDIPNSIDDIWKITVDKSDAQLPMVLRNRLKQIVDKLKRQSSKVYRSKGGKLSDPHKVAVWSRYTRNNEISYSVNRDHPIIARLLSSEDAGLAKAALQLIESNFPVSAFVEDATIRSDSIGQTPASRSDMKRLLDAATPEMLLECDGDLPEMVKKLKRTEPFSANWPMVEEYLTQKGWC